MEQTESKDGQYIIDMYFGTVELQSRIVPRGQEMIVQGRSIYRDLNGAIERVTEWQDTGLRLVWS